MNTKLNQQQIEALAALAPRVASLTIWNKTRPVQAASWVGLDEVAVAAKSLEYWEIVALDADAWPLAQDIRKALQLFEEVHTNEARGVGPDRYPNW